MATDIDAILTNCRDFYDPGEKAIIQVGAGGGQFIRYTANARSVLAVDIDEAAVTQLKAAIGELGLEDRVKVIHGDFSSVSEKADLVFFEFCLHEMDNPAKALLHAQSLAPEILIVDHELDSPWAWHTCEEEKARRSWAAAEKLRIVNRASFKAIQRFDDHSQLLAKIEPLGEPAIARTRIFSDTREIRIEMTYAMALIRSAA